MKLKKFWIDETQIDKAKDLLKEVRRSADSHIKRNICDDFDDLLFEVEQQRLNPVKRKSDANYEIAKDIINL